MGTGTIITANVRNDGTLYNGVGGNGGGGFWLGHSGGTGGDGTGTITTANVYDGGILYNGVDGRDGSGSFLGRGSSGGIGMGNTKITRNLVSRGADVKGARNITPLHLAARGGDVDIVKLLVSKGADVNATAHGHFLIGEYIVQAATPLDFARNTAVIQYLKSVGAKSSEDYDR